MPGVSNIRPMGQNWPTRGLTGGLQNDFRGEWEICVVGVYAEGWMHKECDIWCHYDTQCGKEFNN